MNILYIYIYRIEFDTLCNCSCVCLSQKSRAWPHPNDASSVCHVLIWEVPTCGKELWNKLPESNKASQKMQSPKGNRVFQRYLFNSFLFFRKGNLSVFLSNLHFGSPIWFGTWLIWTHLGTGRNCNNCQTPDTRIKMLLTTSFTCWFPNHHLTHTHAHTSFPVLPSKTRDIIFLKFWLTSRVSNKKINNTTNKVTAWPTWPLPHHPVENRGAAGRMCLFFVGQRRGQRSKGTT